jgi:hypothetical protein
MVRPEYILDWHDIDTMADICKQLAKDGTSFSFSPSNEGFAINIYSYVTIKSYNMLKETGQLRKIDAHSVI